MRQEIKDVIWTWLPGFVAGLVPLVTFVLVGLQVPEVALPKNHPAIHHYLNGWIGHLLVLGMVTSAVSIFSSFPRLFARRFEPRVGEASLALSMIITMILVVSVVFYALFEAGVARSYMIAWSCFVAALATVTSFYVELAIANVELSRTRDTQNAPPVNAAGLSGSGSL